MESTQTYWKEGVAVGGLCICGGGGIVRYLYGFYTKNIFFIYWDPHINI